MKIKTLLPFLVLTASCSIPSGPAVSCLVRPGTALFEPSGFEPSEHLPSPIFVEELSGCGELPSGWKTVPRFCRRFGKSVAVLDVGDADLYGGGEVNGNLRRNGDRQFFWNTDNPTCLLDDGKRMYQSHPWLLGVRKDGSAFGIIADNTWKSKLVTKGKVRFISDGPAFRVIVIEKESPDLVMRELAELTGKMELPPIWALGYQQCRYSYYPQSQVAEIACKFRERKIPCDVIWMDIHYMDSFKAFTFDREGFPDPAGLNGYLHGMNFKTVYMIDPGIKAEEGYFVDDQGRAGDFFVKDRHGNDYVGKVWPGDCHFPDFTSPEVRRWWAGLYGDFMASGIDGIWNDMNEPSIFTDFGGTLPVSCRHRGGDGLPEGPHLRYHNVYGYYMVKASREGIKAANPDKRPFVLSRSNFLGGQRYAASWTGDNFSDYGQMKTAVPMSLNMGLSGQAFNGPDIGGFMRDCTPELLRHWMASGIYFPFARNHSSIGTVGQEPFAFDRETEDVCRRAIERRYRLLPYLYTVFEETSGTGLPVMRPVFWSDFRNLNLRSEQQAYLVGGDLLVIPRWCESPSLPEGDWDLFSFEDADDGYQAWLALRPGAALPVTGVFQSTADYNTDSLTVLVNPGPDGKACGTLYEDAGDGYGYLDGEFARYGLEAFTENGTVTLTLNRKSGKMPVGKRCIRIGLVCDGGVTYSEWSSSGSVSIASVKDARPFIDCSGLKFVRLQDGSISKRLTKTELIMSNIVPKD